MNIKKVENMIWIIFSTIGAFFLIVGSIICYSIFNNWDDIEIIGLIFLVFPGLGLIFFIIGLTGLFYKKKKMQRKNFLKENGNVIFANYTETRINFTYSVNQRYPYNIICEWENPIDDKKYIFKSDNIWINPENIINEKNIKTFPVYINRDNIKEYVVDTHEIENNVVDLT